MAPSYCLSDGTVDCELNVLGGKGERADRGWIQPSIKMREREDNFEDYRTEMNGDTDEAASITSCGRKQLWSCILPYHVDR